MNHNTIIMFMRILDKVSQKYEIDREELYEMANEEVLEMLKANSK